MKPEGGGERGPAVTASPLVDYVEAEAILAARPRLTDWPAPFKVPPCVAPRWGSTFGSVSTTRGAVVRLLGRSPWTRSSRDAQGWTCTKPPSWLACSYRVGEAAPTRRSGPSGP